VSVATRSVGAPVDRVEGRDKVAGEATYAVEYERERVTHAVLVQATVAKGAVREVDGSEALAAEDVIALLWHGNAERLVTAEGELAVLQSPDAAYRG
jgi:xanthine dehydrogenase YagR molybdenum-binding subunit